MAKIEWESPPAVTDIFSTNLNSVADAGTVTSTEMTNGTAKHTHAMLQLVLDFASAPSDDDDLRVHILYENDGGDFPAITPNNIEWITELEPTAGVMYLNIPLTLQPFDFKIGLTINGGSSTAASGNTGEITTYSLETV